MFKVKGQALAYRSRVFVYQNTAPVRLSFTSGIKKVFCFISKNIIKPLATPFKFYRNDEIFKLTGSFVASMIKNWTSIKKNIFFSNRFTENLIAIKSNKIFLRQN